MRRASLSLVPPGMYRHFAAVTLALTTALAMFAEGENSGAKASQIPERNPAAAPKPASFATPPDAPAHDRAPSGWYIESGFDATFGQPMQRLVEGASGNVAMLEEEGAEAAEADAAAPGGLTAADRKRLLRQLRESRAAASAPIGASNPR